MNDIAIKAIEWDEAIHEMYTALIARGKSKGTPNETEASVAFSYAKKNVKDKKKALRHAVWLYVDH